MNHENGKHSIESKDRYLCFILGGEEFAIPLLSVKEVIALPEITHVPQTPPYFLGIMNLRGQVITIIDLRTKLTIKPGQSSENNAVIICDLNPNSIGVVVDSIESVIHPLASEISEKPDLQNTKTNEYVEAVFRKDQRLILLLNIAKTLNVQDLNAISSSINQATKKAA